VENKEHVHILLTVTTEDGQPMHTHVQVAKLIMAEVQNN